MKELKIKYKILTFDETEDGVISNSPDRRANLDRRAANSDRRINMTANYNGPARRNTIDRRPTSKDRRVKK